MAKVMALSGLQYLSIILEALATLLVPASVPHPEAISELMDEVSWLNSFVLRQIHDCRAVLSSPHFVDVDSKPTLYEIALEAHGALKSRH